MCGLSRCRQQPIRCADEKPTASNRRFTRRYNLHPSHTRHVTGVAAIRFDTYNAI